MSLPRRAAGPILGHLSRIAPRDPQNSEDDLPGFRESLARVRSRYSGPLVIAEDLMCIPIGASRVLDAHD